MIIFSSVLVPSLVLAQTAVTPAPSPIQITMISPPDLNNVTNRALNRTACDRNSPETDAFKVSAPVGQWISGGSAGKLTVFFDAGASCTEQVESSTDPKNKFIEAYTQTEINNAVTVIESPRPSTVVTLRGLLDKVGACDTPVNYKEMKYCLQYNAVPGNPIQNTNLIGFVRLYVDTLAPTGVTDVAVYGGDGRLGVTWAPNTADTDIDTYTVTATSPDEQRSVTVKGATTSTATIDGITNGVDYTVVVQAVDVAGNVGPESVPAVGRGVPTCNFWSCYPGAERGGFCFVSTAAYGSYDAPFVQVFRDFRDRVLMKSSAGRALILLYYKHGLAPALWLAEHRTARVLAGVALALPYIAAWPFVRLTPVALIVWAFGSLLCCAALAWVLSRRRLWPLAVLALLGAGEAQAQEEDYELQRTAFSDELDFDRKRTPPRWEVAVKLGPYRPNIDSAPDSDSQGFYSLFFANDNPSRAVFAPGARLRVDIAGDVYFLQRYGLLGLSGSVGFMQAQGKARICEPCTDVDSIRAAPFSGDSVLFTIVPLSLSVVYKLDIFWRRWKIPLVPTVRAGLDYYIWRVDAGGKQARRPDAPPYRVSVFPNGYGQGGTFGWHVNPGLAIALDWIEPNTARRAYSLAGMKGSYLTFEWVINGIDDFRRAGSWDLSSDSSFQAGLSIEL